MRSPAERPASLAERGPHEWVQRHTVEQIIETFVLVPMLAVPLMVDQLVDVLQFFDTLLLLSPSRLSMCPG